ncbi:MAG: Flp pilus assembly complex ATPase component TadA [Brevibacillus sp.]|nr:Flp pilus assembly complex ATPase component TadA [Brevibacillus sp.]
MTFDRKSLLGLHSSGRTTISDIRRSAGEVTRAQQQKADWMQHGAETGEEAQWKLTKEQVASIKAQIVEKYGRKLWEKKHNDTFLKDVAGDLRTLLEMDTTLPSRQLDVEVKRLLQELVGWGALDSLLNDPDITEILVHRFDNVVVERKSTGRIERLQEKIFRDEEQLLRLIEHIAATMGREFNETKAEMHTQLPDGSRVAAVHRSISLVCGVQNK